MFVVSLVVASSLRAMRKLGKQTVKRSYARILVSYDRSGVLVAT